MKRINERNKKKIHSFGTQYEKKFFAKLRKARKIRKYSPHPIFEAQFFPHENGQGNPALTDESVGYNGVSLRDESRSNANVPVRLVEAGASILSVFPSWRLGTRAKNGSLCVFVSLRYHHALVQVRCFICRVEYFRFYAAGSSGE